MNINCDIDPLSTYDYPYDYNSHPLNPYGNIHTVKQEQPMINPEFLHHFMDNAYRNNDKLHPNNQQCQESQFTDRPAASNINNGNQNYRNASVNNVLNPASTTNDVDIKPFIHPKKIKKEKGKKSSYFSEKILDNDFKFYGCSVCNISFISLQELDQHILIHKDRITSYGLKIKKQMKRKTLEKEQKKKKKLMKEVKIEGNLDIEIKPEDGYIGNEKASEYGVNKNENNGNIISNFSNGTDSISYGNNSTDNGNMGANNGNTLNNSGPKGTESLNRGNNCNQNVGMDNGNSSYVDSDSKSDVKESIANVKEVVDNKPDSKEDDNNLAKIYKCFACLKQFTLSYYLKLHVRSHTDEKPYTCNVCGQSFITASKLGRHNKLMHLSVRYQCRICYRFFAKFECLTRHFDKKHPDDKLEGEPYDYNAILPYLKELEEQLKEQSEDTKKQKTEDLWEDWPAPIDNVAPVERKDDVEEKPIEIILQGDMPHVVQVKKEEPDPEFAAVIDSDIPMCETVDVNVQVPCDVTFDNDSGGGDDARDDAVKSDVDAFGDDGKRLRDTTVLEARDEHVKSDVDAFGDDGNVSDDNYFPSGTWVPPTPKPETEADPPPPFSSSSKRGGANRRRSDGALKCDICNKRISTVTYMKVHMRTHTGERPFVCYVCSRGFITSSKLHRHVLTHSEAWADKLGEFIILSYIDTVLYRYCHYYIACGVDRVNVCVSTLVHSILHLYTLKCEVCNKRISTVTYMKVHMRTHTGERPFVCYVCSRGFITSSKLHRHVLTHSEAWADKLDGEEKVKEEIPEKTEEGDNVKKKKKKRNKKDKMNVIKRAKAEFAAKSKGESKSSRRWQHRCEFCYRKFLHAETLQVHKKSHEGETLVFKCHYCLEPQPDEAALGLHEATHTGDTPYLCTDCGKQYRRREAMVYHKRQHKPDRLFYCEICLKSFNAHCKLQRHVQSHRERKYVLRYECPVCAHMFHTKYHVRMHLTTHQKEGLIDEKNHSEILAMVMQNARKFPKHADATAAPPETLPDDDRSRVCNICGETFQHFYYLEEHLKSHGSKIALEDINNEEVKKHICTVCNKAFKLHYYLKLHSFTHTKEKPFMCQQCGKGFITRGKLKRHLETHTGIKKHQCHICCKFFTRSSYLRIHVRTIHGTQDYNSRLGKKFIERQAMDVY
ncbi:zinc finger protein Xfin [Amyelois transitella]|uniref:zinc finger protein Xfin n=1 Tax=Amyelois transitella TaxID=680683 RepID=UPI0029904E50|nr:zinc finger protein Xfin [Amyelois transitella]